jgi:hypothetical protein
MTRTELLRGGRRGFARTFHLPLSSPATMTVSPALAVTGHDGQKRLHLDT